MRRFGTMRGRGCTLYRGKKHCEAGRRLWHSPLFDGGVANRGKVKMMPWR